MITNTNAKVKFFIQYYFANIVTPIAYFVIYLTYLIISFAYILRPRKFTRKKRLPKREGKLDAIIKCNEKQ